MTRQIRDVIVDMDGDDKGKVFRITAMDAWAAEEWGMRALTVMNRANVDLPADALGGGILAIAAYGVRALLSADFDAAKPLLDQMMDTVEFLPAPVAEPNIKRSVYEGDIQEVGTILWLRDHVLEINTGFSAAAVISKLKAHAAALFTSPQTTPTSPPASEE